MAAVGHFACRGFQHDAAARAAVRRSGVFHPQDCGAVDALHGAAFDGFADALRIAILGARKPVAAIDDDDSIAARKSHRILDRRISGADDHDGFLIVVVRAFHGSLDAGMVVARNTQATRIALNTQGKNDAAGPDNVAGLEFDRKPLRRPSDLHRLGTVADIVLACCSAASSSTCDRPRWAARAAALNPPGPAPRMATSNSELIESISPRIEKNSYGLRRFRADEGCHIPKNRCAASTVSASRHSRAAACLTATTGGK